MSDTDKARQKVVESMRKSKAGADDTTVAAKKKAGAKRPSSRTKSRAASAQPARKTRSRGAAAVDAQRGADPYQAKPRVWPD